MKHNHTGQEHTLSYRPNIICEVYEMYWFSHLSMTVLERWQTQYISITRVHM